MASVAIGAGRGSSVASHNGSSMHALLVEFHGMCEWNLVPRKKLLVAVTRGAGVRKIFLGHCRRGIARSLNLVDGPVARNAGRRVGITGRGCLSVDALPEFLHLIRVTLRTLCRCQLRRRRNLVVVSMTGFAGCLARALWQLFGKWDASSSWQLAHRTFATFAGCG